MNNIFVTQKDYGTMFYLCTRKQVKRLFLRHNHAHVAQQEEQLALTRRPRVRLPPWAQFRNKQIIGYPNKHIYYYGLRLW